MDAAERVAAERSVPTPAPDSAAAREDGLWLTSADDVAVDAMIDGRRVWSFNPRRDTKREAGLWHVPWPPPLRPYLDGIAQVTVQEHLTQRVIFADEVQFGTKSSPVRVQDRRGHPLAIDKTGHLGRSFAERDQPTIDALLQAAQSAIAVLRDQGNVPAFLAFGALLGAVREGRLIGHDVDLDIAYFSSFTSPADVARESFQLERLFIRAGWRTWRFSANDFKVLAEGVDGVFRWIDIFGGFVADGMFYLMPNVTARPDAIELLPLSEVVLEGHTLPAPAQPETLLEATYGPGWRTPDPAFKFRTPRATVRRLDAWMRNAIAQRGHWFPFYESARGNQVPTEPSDFARWFADRTGAGARVVDLGCGNGRDSVWLADNGYDVLGLDYAPGAMRRSRALAESNASTAKFREFNLLDMRQILALGGELSYGDNDLFLYGRFLLDALGHRARSNLWVLARTCLRRRGRLYLEFRVAAEPDAKYEFGKHFRQYLTPDLVAGQIANNGGRIEYREEGYGMAVFNDEDPKIGRMVVSWHR